MYLLPLTLPASFDVVWMDWASLGPVKLSECEILSQVFMWVEMTVVTVVMVPETISILVKPFSESSRPADGVGGHHGRDYYHQD